MVADVRLSLRAAGILFGVVRGFGRFRRLQSGHAGTLVVGLWRILALRLVDCAHESFPFCVSDCDPAVVLCIVSPSRCCRLAILCSCARVPVLVCLGALFAVAVVCACLRFVLSRLLLCSLVLAGQAFFVGLVVAAVVVQMIRAALCVVSFCGLSAWASPIVNVKLSAPSDPYPQVGAAIAGYDGSRGLAESQGMRALEVAFEDALAEARGRVTDVMGRFVAGGIGSSGGRGGGGASLVAASASPVLGHTRFLLRVSPVSPPGKAVVDKIGAIERVRASEEAALFARGAGEMHVLVDIVVAELRSALTSASSVGVRAPRAASFSTASAADDLDVRLLPPDGPFPTVAGLVGAMETRRSASEGSARQRVAELQLKLLKAINGMVSEAVRVAHK